MSTNDDSRLSGIDLIALERKRQIKELGYTRKYDVGYADELVHLAMDKVSEAFDILMVDGENPYEAVRSLKKSGALLAAAIDAIHSENSLRPEQSPS